MTPEQRQKKNAAQRAYRKRNKAKIAAYRKAWAERNKDHVREHDKAYYLARRGPIKPRIRRPTTRQLLNLLKERIGCLNTQCSWSGPYHPCTLDFHHLDPTAKTESLSQLTCRRQMMIREIKLCTLVCANCHRLVTWGRLPDQSLPPCDPKLVDEVLTTSCDFGSGL